MLSNQLPRHKGDLLKSSFYHSMHIFTIAAILVALCSFARASSTVTINDDFNDSALNENMWQITAEGEATVTQANGYQEGATQEGVDFSRGGTESLFALTGDFDAQIDYEKINLSNYWSQGSLVISSCDDLNKMTIYVSNMTGDPVESTYYLNGVQYTTNPYYHTGAPSTGKFRITRTGSTMRSYYWKNSAWTLLSTADVFDGPAKIWFVVASNNLMTPGTAPSAIMRWDNFNAEAKGVTGCN